MRICAKCKHFVEVHFLDDSDDYDPADFPTMTETYRNNLCEALDIRNPVNGKRRIVHAARLRERGRQCGPEARLYEVK